MKKVKLPTKWIRWRRRRFGVLKAEGLGVRAWDIAKYEAQTRHQLSRVIGEAHALEAELICVGSGSSMRLGLRGDFAGLTETQVEKLEALRSAAAKR